MTTASEALPEVPPGITEAKFVNLSVTVHSVEGLIFLTELGAQQTCVSILFPSHSTDAMSQLVPPSNKIQFGFSETYALSVYPKSTVNALLANPLEFFLYVCTPDMKKQLQVVRFTFPFDDLLFNESFSGSIEGKVLQEGASVIDPNGIKINIECTWSEPIFPLKDAEESMIASISIASVTSTPLAMINCSTQPNNSSTHIFNYTLAATLPDNQVVLCEDGKFTSTAADGTDASVQFNTLRKIFVGPEEMALWKEACEEGRNIEFLLRPEPNVLMQPLGIPMEQYSAMFGVIEVPLSHFAKPGRSHFQAGVPLSRDSNYSERNVGLPLMSPTGFPPEPVPENKKKQLPRKSTPSARVPTPKGGKGAAPAKKAKALSAKDKKVLGQIQAMLNFDSEKDYFKESTTQLKLEIALSRPIFPRPATPASSKSPEEIVRPLPKMHDLRLANATEEFCRQLDVAIERLKDARVAGKSFDSLKNQLKEELKPSIVEIVKQVYLSKKKTKKSVSQSILNPDKQEDEISEAFMAELRSFLVSNLFKTMNSKFDMTFPRRPPVPPEMDVAHITQRLVNQTYHHTNDMEALHLKRCELDPMNPRWPFELALHYNDIGSPKAMEYFAKAISIDYNFTAAILGFCAQLAKSGNREDCIVLLNMLDQRKQDDPTVISCLSILYQLIESSRTDQFLAKVSQMSARMPRSPNLSGAESLLDVHDTFLSEMMLTKEQLQSGRSKDLLVLLARYTQQNGEYSRAQEYLKEAIELDREDTGLWKMLGSFQYVSEEYDKALSSFEQLLALAEDTDPEVCLRLALIHIMRGHYDKAFDLLMFTVQKLDLSIAWTALGVCCLRMNDYEEAEAALCHANEMDKWDATTWGYCAVLCAKLGRQTEGEQAVAWAARLQLRDYSLIREILEFYDGSAKGDEVRKALADLRAVRESECHKSMEDNTCVE